MVFVVMKLAGLTERLRSIGWDGTFVNHVLEFFGFPEKCREPIMKCVSIYPQELRFCLMGASWTSLNQLGA